MEVEPSTAKPPQGSGKRSERAGVLPGSEVRKPPLEGCQVVMSKKTPNPGPGDEKPQTGALPAPITFPRSTPRVAQLSLGGGASIEPGTSLDLVPRGPALFQVARSEFQGTPHEIPKIAWPWESFKSLAKMIEFDLFLAKHW